MTRTEQGVAFDPSALDQGVQQIVAEREQGMFPSTKREPEANAGISSHSSVTAVEYSTETDIPLARRVSHHFKEDVDTQWTDLLLITCSFISGLLDSAAFNAWGSFANMQTGNIIFLAIGVSDRPSNRWAEALIAIVSFIIGMFFFTHSCRWLKPTRRSTLVGSFTLQTTAVVISCILVQTNVIESSVTNGRPDGDHWMPLVPLALLAFQAAGQITASRFVGVDEIPTLVLTTVMCDLLMDPRLFNGRRGWHANATRNRRLAMVVALFVGAMISSLLAKHVGLSCSLWLAAGLKGGLTVCWLLWRPKREDTKGDIV